MQTEGPEGPLVVIGIQDALQALVTGLAMGSLYGLLGLGFVLLYKGTRVVNFAQGEAVMVGGYAAWVFYVAWALPYPVVLVLVLLSGTTLGLLMDQVLRKLRQAPELTTVMATLAIAIALKGVARLIAGDMPLMFRQPFPGDPLMLDRVAIPWHSMWILAMFLCVVTVGYLIYYKTKAGLGMRAMAQSRQAAQLMGVSLPWVFATTWALASAVGALVGLLFAPSWNVDPYMSLGLLLMSFSAAVLGGFGSLPGVMIGGWLIAIGENMLGLFFGSTIKDFVPFATIFLVLTIKPTGLLKGD